MADERLIQRLEEQLRDAHASNGELRERLLAQEQDQQKVREIESEFTTVQGALDKAHADRKAAQKDAVAAEKNVRAAERKLRHAKEEIENLTAERDRAREEAEELAELNAKVETAKGVRDLFS